MIFKFVLWLILVAGEVFYYPPLFNLIEKVSGGKYYYEGNPFMNWNLIFHNGAEPLQVFLSFNVIILVLVIIWALSDTGFGGSKQKATDEGAYGTARWMTADEFHELYPTYSIGSKQREDHGPFKIWMKFKSRSKGKAWASKK